MRPVQASGLLCHLIGSVVSGIAVVPAKPSPDDPVRHGLRIQKGPEIQVFHPFPALREGLEDILAVRYSVVTDGWRTARSPTIAAVISMRFEMVMASPPLNSSIISSSWKITAAYPPEPPG
jgi:hypothetical protein